MQRGLLGASSVAFWHQIETFSFIQSFKLCLKQGLQVIYAVSAVQKLLSSFVVELLVLIVIYCTSNVVCYKTPGEYLLMGGNIDVIK